MSKWRVYNVHRDGLTHKEKFKGDLIEIKAGDYVLMDYEDAVQFRGQYFPMKMDASGVQLPESYKMIKIEPHNEADAKPALKQEFICQKDGKKFASATELAMYEKQFADEVFVDEAIEQEIKTVPVNQAKRGRPAKEKTA